MKAGFCKTEKYGEPNYGELGAVFASGETLSSVAGVDSLESAEDGAGGASTLIVVLLVVLGAGADCEGADCAGAAGRGAACEVTVVELVVVVLAAGAAG